MKHLKTFNLFEGVAMKSSKSGDSDVKKEGFRTKIEDFIKSKKCSTKKVGNDFEIHCDGENIAQIMFRDEYISVKKNGNKFPKEFKYQEFGNIKKEITEIIKKCCK